MTSTSGMSSTISSPIVPWPATISGSSYAGMGTRLRSCASRCASVARGIVRVAVKHDVGAVRARRLDFRERRRPRHYDRRPHAVRARGDRDALRVVAGARRDDAARTLVRRQCRDAVHRAPDLEGAGVLRFSAFSRTSALQSVLSAVDASSGVRRT